MGPINNLLNRIDNWNDSEAGFKRIIGTRTTNLLVTVPTELVAVAQNVLLTPVYAASTILKVGTKVIIYISDSASAKNFAAKLPGFTELLKTISRIVAYSIGTLLTATLGVISPKTNFNAHCALGLAVNLKNEAIAITIESFKAARAQNEYLETLKLQEALAAKIQDERNSLTKHSMQCEHDRNELNDLTVAYEALGEIRKDAAHTQEASIEVLNHAESQAKHAALIAAQKANYLNSEMTHSGNVASETAYDFNEKIKYAGHVLKEDVRHAGQIVANKAHEAKVKVRQAGHELREEAADASHFIKEKIDHVAHVAEDKAHSVKEHARQVGHDLKKDVKHAAKVATNQVHNLTEEFMHPTMDDALTAKVDLLRSNINPEETLILIEDDVESIADKVFNFIGSVAGNTINTIAHPIRTVTSSYNYVTGYFAGFEDGKKLNY